MTEEQKKPDGEHKRRVRYAGKYPRRFEEKYKEHDPEKYKETIEKVISKGSTPAGMHIPIMVDEILEALKIEAGDKGADCTLGYGGHSSKILEQGPAHLYSLDADPIEIVKTTDRMRKKGFGEDVFTPIHINFRNIDQVAEQYGSFNFLMADLGVSSMQIDNPERGFSYKSEGPLDLRFDPEHGSSAADRLKELTTDEIAFMLEENSDEPYADAIAAEITKTLKRKQPIETTSQLRTVIEKALQGQKIPESELKDESKKACTRTFQALRIDVNSEFEVLYEFLEKLPGVMLPGGRVAILTFHSGEDRLVKKAFKKGLKQGVFSEISEDVIRPSKEECFRNPRAHSTKLRWAVKA